MPYTPKHKQSDEFTLKVKVLAVANFKGDSGPEPMYLLSAKGTWWWSWAEPTDDPDFGDPVPPPPQPN
jgi:hypothetical protein